VTVRAKGMAQVINHLPSNCEALSSNLNTATKKEKLKIKRKTNYLIVNPKLRPNSVLHIYYLTTTPVEKNHHSHSRDEKT
jgi:hypothetical protein